MLIYFTYIYVYVLYMPCLHLSGRIHVVCQWVTVVLFIASGDFFDGCGDPLIGSVPHSPVNSSLVEDEHTSQRKSM